MRFFALNRRVSAFFLEEETIDRHGVYPDASPRLEVSAYQSIMKALAVTGLTWDREFNPKLRIELKRL